MKIQLTLTEHQAIIVQDALEAYARALIGQIKDIIDKSTRELYTPEKHDVIRDIERLYNQLKPQGWGHTPLGDETFEMYRLIRREIAWMRKGLDWRTDQRDFKTMIEVSYDDPMPTGFDLPEIERVEE